MYESHWQLAARPFDHSADARFYYPGESQQGALLKLRYALFFAVPGAAAVLGLLVYWTRRS